MQFTNNENRRVIKNIVKIIKTNEGKKNKNEIMDLKFKSLFYLLFIKLFFTLSHTIKLFY